MRRISPPFVLFCLVMLYSMSISTARAEDDRAEVSLEVTVVAPEYETYSGRGFLFIEDQRAHGKVKLLVPKDEDHPVKLEILKGNEVIASWEWNILEHKTKTIKHRNYEYIVDTYNCEDSDGRRLLIKIYTHRWKTHEMIRVTAMGRGAFFIGTRAPE